MKIEVTGLKGWYTVKFSDTEITIPKKILRVLEDFKVKGFEASVCQQDEFWYLEMIPDSKKQGTFYTIRNGRMGIPKEIKDSLRIEETGFLVGISDKLELWGPYWEKYRKQLEKISIPDLY